MIEKLFQGEPAFDRRGYMLDISRDRVPTMETLEWLVEVLSQLRFNELQLYVEHTFQYRGHERVWRDASPLTAPEVGQLARSCASRGIELVAHVNGFGHMQRWLSHEPYRSRAECPEGAPDPFGDAGTVAPTCLAPTVENASFAVGLATEMLAATGGSRVHIGGDEPFELGDGVSAALVARHGRDKVYVDHLKRIIEPLTERGHKVMFWGDLFRRDPSLLGEIPPGATGVVWNYEAPGERPGPVWSSQVRRKLGIPDDAHLGFEAHTRSFVEAGADFWVAPGTSTWNTILGRNANAAANIDDAAVVGRSTGALGFLLTDWGDNGHWQPLIVSLPSMIRAAVASWNGEACRIDVATAVDELLGSTAGTGAWIDQLGHLGDNLGSTAANGSPIFSQLVATGLPTNGVADPTAVSGARQTLADAIAFLDAGPISGGRGAIMTAELLAACRLADAGLDRMVGADVSLIPSSELMEEFRAAWLGSSRPGGLDDSIAKLTGP